MDDPDSKAGGRAPRLRDSAPSPHLARLMKAEAELEGAIEECRVALEDVRREIVLRRQTNSTDVVH